MRMTDERRITASREVVWNALNDPEVLRRSIPGCESIEKVDEDALIADVTAKVGPVKAKFKGSVRFKDVDPPNGCRIVGESQGGSAGFANGAATVSLVPDGGDTVIKYDVEATVGGKLAQIGSRLVDSTARKMADDFFAEFSRIVAMPPAPGLEPAMASPGVAPTGVSPMVWVPTLVVTVAFFALLFS